MSGKHSELLGKHEVSYKLLCNACLCVGQALNLITDARLKHFYLEALNEIPQNSITNITPVLCLDCEALLKRAISFKKQVKDSYEVLLKYSNEYLQESFLSLVSRTPRLQLKKNNAINISPEENVLEIEPFVKNELKMDWESDRGKQSSSSATAFAITYDLDTIEAADQPDTQQIYLKDDLKIENNINFGEHSTGEFDDDNDIDYEHELMIDNSKKKKTKKGTKEKRTKKEKKKLREKKETKDPSSKIRCIELSYDEMMLERDKEMSKDTYTKSEYKCDSCIMGFKYEKSHKTHLTRRHDPSIGDYKCPVCRTVFATVDSFTSHYKRHMRRYECSICCKRTMDSKVMQQHYYSTHEITLKQYKCIDCGFISNSIDTHRYHRQSHKGRLECPECDKTFRHRAGLLNHRLAVHEYKNKFPCNVCDKVFKWRTSLRRHQDTHENKKTLPAAAYCALCGINFSSMCSYQRHMNNSLKHITKDQLRFVCDHCNKKFADKTKLRNHIEEKHLHKTFQCNICMKTSKNRVGLEQHIRNVHKGRPNNKMCHHCGKGFPTKVQMESHIRTHTGERPFICEYCPTTFSQQSNLYKHNRQVHLNMKSKRYVPCMKIDEPLEICLTTTSLPVYTETGYNTEL